MMTSPEARLVTFVSPGENDATPDPYIWGGLSFPHGVPVLIDPTTEKNPVRAAFLRHVLAKTGSGNRFFRQEAVERISGAIEKAPSSAKPKARLRTPANSGAHRRKMHVKSES